jgi:hypothetical protein
LKQSRLVFRGVTKAIPIELGVSVMKNWEKKIFDETQELFDLFLRLNAHEKTMERIRERILEVENSVYQQRPKNYIRTVLDFIKKNKGQYFSGYHEFYEDLVFNIENWLNNYEKYHDTMNVKRLSPSDEERMRGRDLVDYYNDL